MSLPCWEAFDAQDQAYRDAVLPPAVRKRVSVEAGATLGWERWVGDEGAIIGIDHFGASAPAGTIFEKLGFTADRVADVARRVVREGLRGRVPTARRRAPAAAWVGHGGGDGGDHPSLDQGESGVDRTGGSDPGTTPDADRVRGGSRGSGAQGGAAPPASRRRGPATRSSTWAATARIPNDDYPDFAQRLGRAVRDGEAERGILICGSGVGASVAANKIRGVRAAVCHDTYSAHQGVEHDDMNVLTLGARVIGPEPALECSLAFLGATFSGESRHRRRLDKVLAIEAAGD